MHSATLGRVATLWGVILLLANVASADDSALLSDSSPKNAADEPIVETPALPYLTVMLARDPAVQAELRLNRKQLAGVRVAVALVDEPLWLLRDVPVKQCGDKLDALLARFQKELKQSLTSTQLDRLNQIVLQARGYRALLSPEFVERLRLSAGQVQQLREIVNGGKASREPAEKKNPLTPGPSPAEGRGEKDGRQTKSADAEAKGVSKVLTARQQNELADLVGKQFDLSRVKQLVSVAPELRGVDAWINSNPLTIEQLRGKVVVVHFWTFGCINCIHNLPHYKLWHEKFPPADVTIIGIHTPETAAERSVENVRSKVKEFGIAYPVAFDAAAENWKAWANHMWPSVYLIDKQGNVRACWPGELNWEGAHGEEIMRAKIEELIAEKL